ncbi:MAG: DUF5678 domain-containing protein [Nanoarchaeota archaeon]
MTNYYQYFMKANLDSYVGQWVAICDEKIVSHGKNPKEVFMEAKKGGCSKILLSRVPDKETMIF